VSRVRALGAAVLAATGVALTGQEAWLIGNRAVARVLINAVSTGRAATS
jgi:hypothetical protein